MMKYSAIFAFLLCAPLLFGQAYDNSGGASPNFFNGSGGGQSAGEPGNQNNVMNVGSGSFFESQTSENMADRIFNTDSDSVNLEDGTFNWKGRTFNLGNNRVARARFERYLASPDITSNDEVYLGILSRIAQLLSLVGEQEVKDNQTLRDEIFQAWQMLFKASRYEMDQGVSLVVANQVYNIWRIRDENTSLTRARQVMEEEKKETEKQLLSFSSQDEYEHELRQKMQAQGRTTGKEFDGVTQTTMKAQQLIGLEAQMTAMDTMAVANGQMAKLQFQSQVVNLLLSRRFEHCMIASQFYRYAFKGTHQTITVGSEELKTFIPVSDFTPTVETIELLAREARSDVRTGMDTVDSLYNSNELYGALERLQETFFLGEYQPEVLQFPAEKKRKLHTLYRKLRELQLLVDNKDYDGIERVAKECQELALDFPYSVVMSGTMSAQRASNLALMDAKLLLANLNNDKTSQEKQLDYARIETRLEEATHIWPQNPGIQSLLQELNSKADIRSVGMEIFDNLLQRGDLRRIYDDRAKFGAALMQDPDRNSALEDVIMTMSRVDILIMGAEEMDTQGNSYQAWEMLDEAEGLYPDDHVLARAQAKLAPRVADFVGALDKAKQAESNGDYAISLTRYLEAKDIYPVSKLSRQGIERLSEKVMNNIQPPTTPSASNAAPSEDTGV